MKQPIQKKKMMRKTSTNNIEETQAEESGAASPDTNLDDEVAAGKRFESS